MPPPREVLNASGANPIAYLALILWLPFALVVFNTVRPQVATLIVVIGGTLFLPERLNFDFPLIPPLDKNHISNLSAVIGCHLKMRRQLRRTKIYSGLGSLVWVLLAASAITVFKNQDTLVIGETVLKGLDVHDTMSSVIRTFLNVGVPFLLGRAVFRNTQDLRDFMRITAVLGLIYSLFALIEIRLSPQLHRWIYGYHQHSFAQTMRWGGYRPTIFLEHGLAVGMWFLVSTMAVEVWSRVKRSVGHVPAKLASFYMMVVFVLCKSTGAIAYSALTFPLCLIGSWKMMSRVALLFAIFVIAYPITKVSGTFPEETLTGIALQINAERADSLQDRFDNDAMLTARARERLLFGWGPFGRGRVYDANGNDISVTDGYWIIQLSGQGAIGLGAVFGLLLFPAFVARKAFAKIPEKKDKILLGGFMLMTVFFVVDLLPNGLYNTLPLFFSGALLGISEGVMKARPEGLGPLPRRATMRPVQTAPVPR